MSEGKELRALRVKLKLSRKELANIIGMQSWIPAWESGRSTPPPFVWVAMAKLRDQKNARRRSV